MIKMWSLFYWLIVLPFSLFSIYKYYLVRKNNDLKGVKLYQPLTTFLSLIISGISLFSTNSVPKFTFWIMFGMILAFIADFLNINMTDLKVVIRGLTIFFFSYLIYTIVSFYFAGFTFLILIPIIIMVLIFLVVYNLARKGLPSGAEKAAMGTYGLLISLMVASGISTFFSPNFSIISSIILTMGFTSLFLGDMEFAISSFKKDLNFPYGPILYSGGQLLVAISLFYVAL